MAFVIRNRNKKKKIELKRAKLIHVDNKMFFISLRANSIRYSRCAVHIIIMQRNSISNLTYKGGSSVLISVPITTIIKSNSHLWSKTSDLFNFCVRFQFIGLTNAKCTGKWQALKTGLCNSMSSSLVYESRLIEIRTMHSNYPKRSYFPPKRILLSRIYCNRLNRCSFTSVGVRSIFIEC